MEDEFLEEPQRTSPGSSVSDAFESSTPSAQPHERTTARGVDLHMGVLFGLPRTGRQLSSARATVTPSEAGLSRLRGNRRGAEHDCVVGRREPAPLVPRTRTSVRKEQRCPYPDLTEYVAHRSSPDAAFEGTTVPGLRADFYRRPDGDRIASVGRCFFHGREVLMAWGYVDEQHCRRQAVHDPARGWQPVVDGCPDVRVVRAGDAPDAPVVWLKVRTPEGEWLSAGGTLAQP